MRWRLLTSIVLAAVVASADSGYVNSVMCAGCHQEIARSYALTGMGRSISRPGSRPDAEGASARFYHEISGRYYSMFQRDGKFFQRRHQTGFNDAESNVVEKVAHYVIGSGNHVRSYLHRTQEGRLIELPVSWYAEQGGHWAMSPGYDRSDHLDFRRAVSSECIFCHAAYPQPERGGLANLEAIDCQRCHGPGRAHVESRGAGAIVNPARLSRDRQLDLCMQCHLETTASFPVASLRRYGRDPFSYRPGEPLGDFAAYFDQAPSKSRDQKFEIGYAAYGLRKSICFQKSQMTCSTCHNPHQIPRAEQATEHYVAVCQSCHSTQHTSVGKCLDCHMPKRRTDDVVHAAVTDHRIQRQKPAGDLLAPLREANDSYRGDVVSYYPLPPTPDGELYLAVAQVRYSADLAAGIPRLLRAIGNRRPGLPGFYFEAGVAFSKGGNTIQAVRWYDEALRHGDYLPARKALGEALLAAGQVARAAAVLEKIVADSPADTETLYALGSVYFRQGRLATAAQVLQRALETNPDLPLARNLLGNVQSGSGNPVAAAEQFREAIRVQPDLDLAHTNLGLLLARDGDYLQAAYHLEKALASNPTSVEARYAYGLVMVERHEFETAERHFRLALEGDPNYYPAHLALGRILASRGALVEARRHLRKAAESPVAALRQEGLMELRKIQ